MNEFHRWVDKIAGDTGQRGAADKKRKRLAVEAAIDRLRGVSEELDPIRRPANIFDPTDPTTAARIVALTLVAQVRRPLAEVPEFYGSGVYAIYYRGGFAPYARLARSEHPIYVGKADPDDSTAKDPVRQGAKLSARLREHARNIGKAGSLRIEDFDCRFLVVQSGFQKSAEGCLIDFFKPIWNSETKICFGLGKHGDSSDTRANKRSPWDTMHPGRAWATATATDQKPKESIIREIERHFALHPPYANMQQIFAHFVSEVKQLGDLAK